jgi:hypothetical protein
MDFSVIFQLRTKKFWWMDVIFYFVISLLVATILCYIIFLTKNFFQRQDIQIEIEKLQTVGTYQQKEYEKTVINYRNKINDFSVIFKNHQFASNVFAFLQIQTMPNIWFKQFSLDQKNGAVQLSGEAEDLDGLSRQIKVFENEDNKKYVKNVGTLNSTLGQSARIEFNVNLALDQSIFSYLASLPAAVPATTTASEQPPPQQEEPIPTNATGTEALAGSQSNEKLITAFHFLTTPEVVGVVDQTNYNITLDVPFGTDIKNLTTAIVISSNATVLPESGVPQDFTNPVIYMVTAQDGSIRSYKVTVNVLPQIIEKSSRPSWIIWVTIILIIIVIIIIAGAGFIFWQRRKNSLLNT